MEDYKKTQKKPLRIITYVLLALWAIVVLFPFYWMLLTSVKSYSSYNSEYIPKFFTLSGIIIRERKITNTIFFPLNSNLAKANAARVITILPI